MLGLSSNWAINKTHLNRRLFTLQLDTEFHGKDTKLPTASSSSSSSSGCHAESILKMVGFLEQAYQNNVKKKEEEALRHKMKVKALKECDQFTQKYAECASGRTISAVWKCRQQFNELNVCLHQFTNDTILEEMKKEYMLQQDGKRPARVSSQFLDKPQQHHLTTVHI
ncbi:Cytochrome c oxidase biogenesis protein Cmc1-like [Euphorbia peplus]|nr:Cytochrome c oxidase biogenesis protein Cmc1-like [Euphorbia peplus]